VERLRKQALPLLVIIILVVLVGGGGFLLGKNAGSAKADNATPPNTPLPAHTTLTRTETYFIDNVQNWYYSVAHGSEDTLIAFYQTQLPKQGWRCVAAMKTTHMTYYGQPLAGTGVYISAQRGTTKAQIYMGDQEYGAFLLSDDLPAAAIALKLSYEPSKATSCTGP